MDRIEKLTPEQEAMFPVWRDKWIDIGLKTGETDWETFGVYMPICYQKAGLEFPKKVIRVSSPIVGAFASSIANKILKNKGKSVHDAVHGAVHDAVGGAVGGAVHDAVGGAVHGAVHDAVHDAVHGAVHDAVHDAVHGAVHDAKLEWHFWLGGQFWVGGWWGSPAYVSFFTDVCKLKLNVDIQERATAYRKVCESVNYIWCNSEFVMVCARPTKILRNAQGRLHSDTGKAIEYPDGWGLYFLNGVRFDEKLFKEVTSKKMPFKDILAIKDVDQRRQAMKYGSWSDFTESQNATKIDEFTKLDINGEPVSYELWEFPFDEKKNREERLFTKTVHFARYLCPSTREWHTKGVPALKTVAEVMAWGMSTNERIVSPENWKLLVPLQNES